MCNAAVLSLAPCAKNFLKKRTILLLLCLKFTVVIYLYYPSENISAESQEQSIQEQSIQEQFGESDNESHKELKYSQPFQYPLVFEEFPRTVEMFRTGEIKDSTISPINPAFISTEFLQEPDLMIGKNPIGLLIIVKSARNNVEKRKVVRNTWGNKEYLQEAVISKDRVTKVFFICGTENASSSDVNQSMDSLTEEINEFKDIILADFVDSYYNNTFKSVLALKWSLLYGRDYQFLALVDDDIHFDIVNLCNYLRNLIYKRVHVVTNHSTGYPLLKLTHQKDEHSVRISDLDHGLMIGHAKWDDSVIRNRLSKWHVSYEEYPYNKYPPYHPGAGIIFDHRAVQDLYYGSLFVKYYRMDDVFLGIVAAKLKILILDCRDIQTEPKVLASRSNNAIIVHGLHPAQRQALWVLFHRTQKVYKFP